MIGDVLNNELDELSDEEHILNNSYFLRGWVVTASKKPKKGPKKDQKTSKSAKRR